MEMEIYIADIEELLKNFKPYQDSVKAINEKKLDFNEQMNKIKVEMEGIINSTQRNIILDGSTKEYQQERFNQLQRNAMELQDQFQDEVGNMQTEALETNLKQLKDIIQEWCEFEKIPLIANKNTMLYVSDKLDATPRLFNVLKKKGLYNEFNEEEFKMELEKEQ